jgi:hypothetical protein
MSILRLESQRNLVLQAAKELANAPWAVEDMHYVPSELYQKLRNEISALEKIQVEHEMTLEGETRIYTFPEWIKECLQAVDEGVQILEEISGRYVIKLNGEWHLATIYGPPKEVLWQWFDVYPRQVQKAAIAALLRGLIEWYGPPVPVGEESSVEIQ